MSYQGTYESEDHPRITPAVQWLIAINVAILFLQKTVVKDELMMGGLGFSAPQILRSWWTVVTYMFVHGGYMHLAVNMYTLWMFGPRLEHVWGTRTFAGYYLWCGIGGLVFHALLVQHGVLIGASAAIFGVMLAYGMRWPNDEVLFFGVIPMKVKWLVGLLLTLNLWSGILQATGIAFQGSQMAYMAHLGGLVFGWLYLRRPAMPSIERFRQHISPAPDIPDDERPRAIPRSMPRGRERERERERESEVDEVVAQSRAVAGKRPVVAAPQGAANREENVETLNRLLDKISQQGISSLTVAERRELDEVSRGLKEG
jgi:membrane associated rhomboid family serine protease